MHHQKLTAEEALAFGNDCFARAEYSMAIIFYNRIIAKGCVLNDIFLAEVYNNRGIANMRLNKLTYAIKDLTCGISFAPKHPTLYRNRLKAFCQQKNYDLALDDAFHLIKIDNKNPVNYHYRAQIYFHQKKYNLAEIDYLKALKLNKKFIKSQLSLSQLYVEIKQYDKAFLGFVKTLAIDSTLSDIQIELIKLLNILKENPLELKKISKLELFLAITSLRHQDQLMFLEDCLEAQTELGKHMQSGEDWFINESKEDTLSELAEHLRLITPHYSSSQHALFFKRPKVKATKKAVIDYQYKL